MSDFAIMLDALRQHIHQLTNERDQAQKQFDSLSHHRDVLLLELAKLRDKNIELLNRNTRLLSQLQELEAREQ